MGAEDLRGDQWPESDAIHKWLDRHLMELKQAVTKERIETQDNLTKYRAALIRVLEICISETDPDDAASRAVDEVYLVLSQNEKDPVILEKVFKLYYHIEAQEFQKKT